MKKKLFIEDLEKRRSTSPLFITTRAEGETGSSPDKQQPEQSGHKWHSPRVSTNVAGEEGDSSKSTDGPQANGDGNNGGDLNHGDNGNHYGHTDPNEHGNDFGHHRDERIGTPQPIAPQPVVGSGGGATTLAMGEEGDGPIPIAPQPVVGSGGGATTLAMGEEGDGPIPIAPQHND